MASFLVVLLAEFGVDKTVLALGCLAREVPALRLAVASIAALTIKMAVVCFLGARLSTGASNGYARVLGCIGFLATAALHGWKLLRLRRAVPVAPLVGRQLPSTFAAIFVSLATELVDHGVIAAVTIASRAGSWVLPWIGASVAMAVKALVGIFLGHALLNRVSLRTSRLVACAGCTVMAIVSLFD